MYSSINKGANLYGMGCYFGKLPQIAYPYSCDLFSLADGERCNVMLLVKVLVGG